jgi:phosphoglycerol transferase MdoB-like AlkP superfamily enzyme
MKQFLRSNNYYRSNALIILTWVFFILLKFLSVEIIQNKEFSFAFVFLFVKSAWYDSIYVSYAFFLILLLTYILQLKFKKSASYFVLFACALTLTIETGLSYFTQKSGFLLDREILIRPIKEMTMTVWNSGYFLRGTLGLVIIISLFVISGIVVITKLNIQARFIRYFPAVFLIIIVISFFTGSSPDKENLSNYEEYIFTTNKSLHLIKGAFEEYRKRKHEEGYATDAKPDYAIIKPFCELQKIYTPESIEYPFCRKDNTPDVLSPFFDVKDSKPNIVIIVVESLGTKYSGINASLGSFTPFLDSLAEKSLYWPNCLSTSQRTVAVLPSLLGSLPHGKKGFQFNLMPYHRSLVSECEKNGYGTNFFYPGSPDFDCMNSFLVAQHIDFIPPLYGLFLRSNLLSSTNWGFDDMVLYAKALDFLENETFTQQLSIFLTVTTHEELNLGKNKKYIKQANDINSHLSIVKRAKNEKYLPYLASFVYADDALRYFLELYKKRKDFKNTIFIITGDHSSWFNNKNELSKYQVPLIIYSPLLKRSAAFQSVISHLDLAPSLVAFLQGHQIINKPEYVAWISKGLDTMRNFGHSGSVLFLAANRQKSEYCEGPYFLSFSNLFRFDSQFDLFPVDDQTLKKEISSHYENMKYVDQYVCQYNRFLKPEKDENKYKLIYSLQFPDEKEMITPNKKSIICTDLPVDSTYKYIRVNMTGEIQFDTLIYDRAETMKFVFNLKAKGMKFPGWFGVYVYHIAKDELIKGRWMRMQFGREYDIANCSDISLDAFFWNQEEVTGDRLKYKNLKITIEARY